MVAVVRCGTEISHHSSSEKRQLRQGDLSDTERPPYSLHTLYLVNGTLTYLKRSATGTWTTQNVDPSRFVIQGAIDMFGQVAHVSYNSNSAGSTGVRYANNATGAFQNTLSVSSSITNGFDENAIAVDNVGVVHIAHDAKPTLASQSQRETYGSMNSWTNATTDVLTDPITTNAYFAGSSIHANNGKLIMHGHPKRSGSPLLVNIRNPLWYQSSVKITTAGSAQCVGSAWGGEAKITKYAEGHSVYHCVATGIPQRTSIGYAHNESGQWVTQSLASGPDVLPAPARPVTYMDNNDTLHLVYEQGGLKYQYRPRKGAWSAVVALPTISGVPSHVVAADSPSSVDILYVDNFTIKHLTNASGSWVSKIVMTLTATPQLQKGMKITY